MLADPHLRVAHFEPDSHRLFPGLADTIKGGIAVTFRDANQTLGPIGKFTKYLELDGILGKVTNRHPKSIMDVTINRSSHTYDRRLFNEHPDAATAIGHTNLSQIMSNAFDVLTNYFHEEQPQDGAEYVKVLGYTSRKRAYRWMRRDYLKLHPSADKWKVAVAKANGTGSTTDFFGIPLTNPTILGPGTIVTNTFITIGSLDTEDQAQALLKYLKSKFARAMLGVLKDYPRQCTTCLGAYSPIRTSRRTPISTGRSPSPRSTELLYTNVRPRCQRDTALLRGNVKPME